MPSSESRNAAAIFAIASKLPGFRRVSISVRSLGDTPAAAASAPGKRPLLLSQPDEIKEILDLGDILRRHSTAAGRRFTAAVTDASRAR